VSEIEVVVLPSPAFVGVIAVVITSLPSGRSARRSRIESETLARYRPYGSTSSARMPAAAATSSIGRRTASCAISSPLFRCSRLSLWPEPREDTPDDPSLRGARSLAILAR
jgi:hypothetical protein